MPLYLECTVGFEPNATMNTAHHMLMYGCGEPGSKSPIWNCGEMSQKDNSDEVSASPCGEGSHSQIIYAWARDAPKLELPENVGFKVGKDSPIKYIVLQVHYAHVEKFKGSFVYRRCLFSSSMPTGFLGFFAFRWKQRRFRNIHQLYNRTVSK
jgi:Copper type II ascorbate-dependent monooxygenase, N-terminal domain